MRVPGEPDRAGAVQVHLAGPSQYALGRLEGCIALPQDQHGLVAVLLRVHRDGLVALHQLPALKLDLLGNPQPRGHQQDSGRGR